MKWFIGLETSSRAMRLPECNWKTSDNPLSDSGRREPEISTFEEERRDALASVLECLATAAPDPDRTAACFHLLRHLTRPAPLATAC